MGLVGTFYSFVMGLLFVPRPWWWVRTGVTACILAFLVVRGALAPATGRLVVTSSVALPIAAVLAASLFGDVCSDRTTRSIAFSQPFLLILAVKGWEAIRSRPLRRFTEVFRGRQTLSLTLFERESR